MIIKLDKEYEVKCTLGTIRAIEKRFNKPFIPLMSDLNKLTTTEQIKILYCGFVKANPDISEEKFCSIIEENIGIGELADILENYVYQLQYPGKSKEEVEEIVQKKLQKANRLNSIGKN